MTRTSTARTAVGEFSMYTPKHIAEAMAELFDDPKWGGGVWARQPLLGAICGIESRVRRPFGRSTDAVDERGVLAPNGTEAPDGEGDAAPYRETHTLCWTPGRNS